MKHPLTFLLVSLLGLAACQSPAVQGPATAPALPLRQTWLVVLDLSDRLLTPRQLVRDTALVGAAARQFLAAVRAGHYIGSADCFRVVVAPQAGMPAAVDPLREGLTLDMVALPAPQRCTAPARMRALLRRVAQLYAVAGQRPHAADYAGTDLWHYFRDHLPHDLAPDPAYRCRNQVLVLTDGYFDFEDYRPRRAEGHRYSSTRFVAQLARLGAGWADTLRAGHYGLLPIGLPAHLRATTTVTVAEVAPHSEYEGDILAAVWQNWLREAGLQAPPRLLLRAAPVGSVAEQLLVSAP